MAATGPRTTRLARPVWGVNHVLSYGQSYSNGWEGDPGLSLEPRPGNLMFGDSVRPWSETAPQWQPVGEAAFRPLRATVQEHFGGKVLSPAQLAATPADAALLGETVLESALNFWRARMCEDAGGPDTLGQLLGSACGVGGQPIEALSRGAEPDLFNRLRDCVRAARALAHSHGRSYGIVAILVLQGEHNNFAVGGTADTAEYSRLSRRLHADILEDIVQGIADQEAMPALITYQTGGLQASDSNSVAQAQLENSLSLPGCFMASPGYPMPTKKDHLDANGYRWLGAHMGRVLHRVVSRGEDFLPVHPLAAARQGDAVRLAFHVPHPPLVWGRPFVRQSLENIRHRGFALFDDAGEVPIADVALVGPTEVRITAARKPRAGAFVRYASAARAGRGCLHDSDPTLSDDRFDIAPEQRRRPSPDISARIGKPYPLTNWCAAFTLAVG